MEAIFRVTVGSPARIGAEPPPLAKRPNYDFEKRKKELARQAKKAAKREERLQRREGPNQDADPRSENGPEGAAE